VIILAIKIQTQQTHIPIELGDLKLKFDISDDSLIDLRKKIEEVQNIAQDIDTEGSDSEVMDRVKGVMRRAYDDLFGEGTFDKVYEVTPSILVTTQYFLDMAQGLGEEMEKRGFTSTSQEKLEKYLQNKNKKNQQKKK